MKHKYLRALIKRTVPQNDFVLKKCNLVIDGTNYFKNTYKRSGCQFILGGEYDRYALYLKNELKRFVDSDVTCYVIFNGAKKADIDVRLKIHQYIINDVNTIEPGKEDNFYSEPIFVKDVVKEVLEELQIKYYVAEYTSTGDIVSAAKNLNCPVLTFNFEYCLYGVSCITPNTISFDNESKRLKCSIFKREACKKAFSLGDTMPIFITLVDEDSLYYSRLPEIIECRSNNLLPSVLRWVRRQVKEGALRTITRNLNDNERAAFMKSYDANDKVYHDKWCTSATKKSYDNKKKLLSKSDEHWFSKGVATGRIAAPYINLKYKGSFSGSWLIHDKNKEDAMLSAIDIVLFVYELITDSEQSSITFVGRKGNKSCVWAFKKETNDTKISNESLFEFQYKKHKQTEHKTVSDLFRYFIKQVMPGFKFELLKKIPEDCRILIITLVYFCSRNRDAIFFAYSILLSYVMLGPVSEKTGIIKRSNFHLSHNLQDDDTSTDGLTFQACAFAANTLMDLFHVDDIKKKFNRSILHTLAEFQHCLQHMNYLNKLCGEKIESTVYHKAFNATFVYNAYLKIEGVDRPMRYFEERLRNSPVLEYYKNIERVFEECLTVTSI